MNTAPRSKRRKYDTGRPRPSSTTAARPRESRASRFTVALINVHRRPCSRMLPAADDRFGGPTADLSRGLARIANTNAVSQLELRELQCNG